MARSMVRAAIRTGARMGISLTQGDMVEATGNCLLESVKGNVEDRDIFERKIEETITSLRESCADEGEKVIGASPYRIEDYSEEDWARGWHQLKHSGVWDVEYFGDLMIIALAHYIRKNILLINTDPASAPVTVVLGDRFGRPLDSEHPVILAYSGTHYEGLLPVTDRDEAMARRIIQKYIKGEDLFSGSEEQSPDLIRSRRIFIEKCEPTIDAWDSSQQPQVAAASPPSPSCDVEAGEHGDQGLESWRRHHPANTGTFPTQWASSGNLDTISIPIKIVTSQH